MLKQSFEIKAPPNICRNCSDDIAKNNLMSLFICSLSGLGLNLVIMVFALYIPSVRLPFIMYGGMGFGCLIGILLTFTVLKKQKKMTLPVFYVFIAMIFAFTIILGTVYSPNQNAASFVGMVAVLPSLIVDKPWRITAFTFIPVAIFCIISLYLKEFQYSRLDCFNVLTLFAAGNLIMRHTVKTKLAYLLSLEQIKWNESRYRALLLETNDVIFEYDSGTDFVHIFDNNSLFPQTDMTVEALKNYNNIYSEDRSCAADLVERIINLKESTIYEEMRIMKDGCPTWFSVYATTLKDSKCNGRRIIGKLTDIDAQKRREERLRVLSQIDQLTGLYNKFTTEKLITEYIEQKSYGCHALLLADMDDLKHINDTYGHTYGDSALNAVAMAFKSSFRRADIVGRVGGDEFMAFLCDCGSASQAEKLAGALLAKINSLSADNSVHIPISISIGISVICRNEPDGVGQNTECASSTFYRLYREADSALYKIKRSGKGNLALYETDMKLCQSEKAY